MEIWNRISLVRLSLSKRREQVQYRTDGSHGTVLSRQSTKFAEEVPFVIVLCLVYFVR